MLISALKVEESPSLSKQKAPVAFSYLQSKRDFPKSGHTNSSRRRSCNFGKYILSFPPLFFSCTTYSAFYCPGGVKKLDIPAAAALNSRGKRSWGERWQKKLFYPLQRGPGQAERENRPLEHIPFCIGLKVLNTIVFIPFDTLCFWGIGLILYRPAPSKGPWPEHTIGRKQRVRSS